MAIKFNTVKFGADNKPVSTFACVTFIVPVKQREHNIAGFVQSVTKFNPHIIFVVQADDRPFNKGALYNLGYAQSTSDLVIFADVDIRFPELLNFAELMNQVNVPFVPFDRIRDVKEGKVINTCFRQTAWGGCAVFTRKQFEGCGGFTNRIENWGLEDELMQRRSKMIRFAGILEHVHHERKHFESLNSGQLAKNRDVLNNDAPHLDNYKTVKGKLVFEYKEPNITWLAYTDLGNNGEVKTGKKQCIINQFFGLGDIIFIEPICRHYLNMGYDIVFPVIPKYLEIAPYFPYIKFVDQTQYEMDYNCQRIIDTPEKLILPIRWSQQFLKSPDYRDCMRNKYLMVNLDLETWRTATWKRNRFKESKLKQILGISDTDKFNLINRNFASRNVEQVNINVKNAYKNIEMDFVEGFTMFDWCDIIEQETTIHTANTSILYFLELLDLNAKSIHLYSRNEKGKDFRLTDYLRSKKYILHD